MDHFSLIKLKQEITKTAKAWKGKVAKQPTLTEFSQFNNFCAGLKVCVLRSQICLSLHKWTQQSGV